MEMFREVSAVYLHRDPVDFRKSINGLSVIVEQDMGMSPFSGALYLFCNRSRDKLKLIYWDQSGFALFYKRLEQDKFHWPRRWPQASITLSEAQLHWLLSGYDITRMHAHKTVQYSSVS
jgi:transposase